MEWVIKGLGGGFGKVEECNPFQGSVWCKMYVLNYNDLRVDVAPIVSESPADPVKRMNYRITEVTFLKEVQNG